MGTRRLGRYVVETSNEDKVLFPEAGITKGDLMDYYERVASHLLPHLRERAVMLRRFPDGIVESGFYQKTRADYYPDWVGSTRVSKRGGGTQTLAVCRNAAALVFLANQATIELHAWLSRRDRPRRPDQLVVDLDPPDGDFAAVRRVARGCKALLDELGLPGFVKSTGSRGLHVLVPLDRRAEFEAARAVARDLARLLARRHPREVTIAQRRARRDGRIFLDVGRNAYAQTAVAPYSVRARAGAPVAAPLEWEELSDRALRATTWTIGNVLRRLGQRDDPWSGLARHACAIARVAGPLAAMLEDEAGAA